MLNEQPSFRTPISSTQITTLQTNPSIYVPTIWSVSRPRISVNIVPTPVEATKISFQMSNMFNVFNIFERWFGECHPNIYVWNLLQSYYPQHISPLGCVWCISAPSLEESSTVALATKAPKVAPKVRFFQIMCSWKIVIVVTIMMTFEIFWYSPSTTMLWLSESWWHLEYSGLNLHDPPWQHLCEYLVHGKRGRVQV